MTPAKQVGGPGYTSPKVFVGTGAGAPVSSNDQTVGVDVGDMFIDTVTPQVYICTNAATGAAVWSSPPSGAASTSSLTVAGPVTEPPGASTAAAGTTTADAGVLPAATAAVYPTTAADGTKGVRIHAADKVTGRMLFIGNGVAAQALKIYPPSGGTINGAAADAAFVSTSGSGITIYCLNGGANTWLASS
jgi:hypothetical protein